MYCPLIQPIKYQSPLQMFEQFAGQHGAIFFDSAELRLHCGRYSFIGIEPFATLSSKNGVVQMNDCIVKGDPFLHLQQYLNQFVFAAHPDLPPFQGGVAGFFGYDLYQHLEDIPLHKIDDMKFPDMVLGFYDVVIAFDHECEKAWIFSSGFPELDKNKRKERAQERMQWIKNIIFKRNTRDEKEDAKFVETYARDSESNLTKIIQHDVASTMNNTITHNVESNFTETSYQQAVNKTINYILAGDIFEACISQRFKTSLPKHTKPFHLYCQLRLINPAPFSAYLNFFDMTIASASPERFLQLRNRKIESRPIKGTCIRGKNAIDDAQFAKQLLNSEKDHAENVMIVDLLRNDLSRVCEDHSVKVQKLCGLESYASVHHLVSVITGQLQNGLTAVDLLRATFPGGSITGAPKIRAMEIIAEIEPNQRGPYCGSIGYIGFDGDMDASIIIRSYAIKNNIITFQTGGAIVVDSKSRDEYQETLVKAKALHTALTLIKHESNNDFVN